MLYIFNECTPPTSPIMKKSSEICGMESARSAYIVMKIVYPFEGINHFTAKVILFS